MKPSTKEICICAAVKTNDGEVFRCHRHADGILAIAHRNREIEPDMDKREGFITSRNRYVNRKEGMKLQLEAGIKSAWKEGYMSKELFSEDLY